VPPGSRPRCFRCSSASRPISVSKSSAEIVSVIAEAVGRYLASDAEAEVDLGKRVAALFESETQALER